MPVKNTEQYVGECIESILDQTFEDWELIAVNDQSEDDSLSVMESYSDPRITVISNPDSGLLQALRLGYTYASGPLITRMDSDDKMPADKLQLMYDAWMKQGKNTVITGGAEYFVDQGEPGDGFKRYVSWLSEVSRKNTHHEHIYKESVIASNCWLVHRDDFDRIGGFEYDTFPEDYDLCFRFYADKMNIVGLDANLHLWRDRPDRISRTRQEYRDNRFFALKTRYFFQLERDLSRPLVLWGAGKNAKDLAKEILNYETDFHWICDNPNKIGKDIYGLNINAIDTVRKLPKPQVIIAVSSPEGQNEIQSLLNAWEMKAVKDYWFFS